MRTWLNPGSCCTNNTFHLRGGLCLPHKELLLWGRQHARSMYPMNKYHGPQGYTTTKKMDFTQNKRNSGDVWVKEGAPSLSEFRFSQKRATSILARFIEASQQIRDSASISSSDPDTSPYHPSRLEAFMN